jgi:ComF family protein
VTTQAATLLRGQALRLGRATLDFLLPPHCPSCDAQVEVQGTFCPTCFARLNFITAPLCTCCGLPFGSAAQGGRLGVCLTCTAHPPQWHEARAALVYDDAARALILPFKNAGREELAQVLAAQMARAGRTLLARADILVPVPLHRWRLFRRGCNQAALLARVLAHGAGLPVGLDALRRVRRTPPLGPLSAVERARMLQGALAVRARRATLVRGRRVLLVDDVMTSGATANACAEVLRAAGCVAVDVLVAARVPDPRRV